MIWYLGVIETYGQDIATHRSIDIAIRVLTDAETDTPCMYDTTLQMNVPKIHSEMLHVKEDEKEKTKNTIK